MRAEDAPWERLLKEATKTVMASVSSIAAGSQRTKVVGIGASGDKTLLADRVAEEEVFASLSKVKGLRILSEEAGEKGDPKARHVAVIDPLDGSSNFERGIPFYCTSVAIASGNSLEDVDFGMVRDLNTGDLYFAQKGKGATKNGKVIRTSNARSPSSSVVGIDISRSPQAYAPRLGELAAHINRQVHFGANALELCYLADGRFDAFIDLRGRARVTDVAAGLLIVTEAGASVSGPDGKALDSGLDLRSRFSFVASANRPLHRRMLKLCEQEGGQRRAVSKA